VEKPVENSQLESQKLNQEAHLQYVPQSYSKKTLRRRRAAFRTILQHLSSLMVYRKGEIGNKNYEYSN
jgi:hypothetical protein